MILRRPFPRLGKRGKGREVCVTYTWLDGVNGGVAAGPINLPLLVGVGEENAVVVWWARWAG